MDYSKQDEVNRVVVEKLDQILKILERASSKRRSSTISETSSAMHTPLKFDSMHDIGNEGEMVRSKFGLPAESGKDKPQYLKEIERLRRINEDTQIELAKVRSTAEHDLGIAYKKQEELHNTISAMNEKFAAIKENKEAEVTTNPKK